MPKTLKELLEDTERAHLRLPATAQKDADIRGESYRGLREMARRLRKLDEMANEGFSECVAEHLKCIRRILDGEE